ncbi:MAG: hypothetical protein KKH04_19770 [Proteobacteria bacterium]|nr:hypothetical protein [Pseudomonadota bacterium]
MIGQKRKRRQDDIVYFQENTKKKERIGKMTFMDNNESSLAKLISSELEYLLKQVEADIKQRNSTKKYLSHIRKAFEESDTETLNRLLLRQLKDRLLTSYPTAKEIFEKLSIDVKRRSEQVFSSLFTRFQEYCSNNKISLHGKLPKLFVDYLLEVEMDENKQTAKIGTIFLKTLDWEKIRVAIDRERHRIWEREFDPTSFRDHLLNVYLEIIKVKPNPVGWVRLEGVYQSLKRDIQQKNPNWKKGGRLVPYYKDEFSADLSKLWEAQISRKSGSPHIELSGIRDPRLSYKVVLPDGQIQSYGHMRPKKEET